MMMMVRTVLLVPSAAALCVLLMLSCCAPSTTTNGFMLAAPRSTAAAVVPLGSSSSDRRTPFFVSREHKRRPSHHVALQQSQKDDQDDNVSMVIGMNSTSASMKDNDNKKQKNQLDWKAIRKQAVLFRQMALPYYQESKTGRWLLVVLLGLTLLNSGVSVAFSYLGKDFWNALSSKDVPEFYMVLRNYCGALLVGAPIVTLFRYQREQLAVHWREWMTARTFSLYTTNRVYYNLERSYSLSSSSEDGDEGDDDRSSSASTTTTIDNPDQRISEDVNSFTSYSLQLVITIITSLIDLVSFAAILWSIYPQLFGAIILYALFGTAFTTFLGQSLVSLNFGQLQKEADLRYSLVRLRDNSESIAFYAGEDLEGQQVEQRLESVMDNRRQINVAQRNLELFTNSYRYLVQILPVAVVAPQYFAGVIPLGVISQSVGAFNHILNDLSIIVNQFERLSSFSAGIARLSSFYQAMQDVNPAIISSPNAPVTVNSNGTEAKTATPSLLELVDMAPPPSMSYNDTSVVTRSNGVYDDKIGYGMIQLQKFPPFDETSTTTASIANGERAGNLVLSIDHLDLVTPDYQQRLLIQDLSLKLYEKQHLLIVGNSGAGKSSLLRAVAGLWTVGNGRIERPDDADVYFLPQRPYCTLGSLKDQLLYPSIERNDEYEAQLLLGDDDDSSNDKKDGAAANGQKIIPRAHWLKETISDKDLLHVLEQVDLLDLAKRVSDSNNKNADGTACAATAGLNAVLDWSNVLSLGEQQRLAFGRVLVNRPRLVILDEATSALDMVAEARMYGLLQKLSASGDADDDDSPSSPLQRRIHGLTYISVGHRPSLLKYHDKRLRLKGTAGFELSDIEKSSTETMPSGMLDQEVSNL